jgi:RNA polymerase-binding transcription factor DksA
MTPASKGPQAKRPPTSRSTSTSTSRSGNKSHAAKVGATASKRPALTKKKAAPVVKKAATPTKKAPATAKKAAPAAVKKVPSSAKKAPATAHKAAPAKKAVPAKKAAPAKKAVPTKQAAPAAKKAPAEKAAAKKAAPAAKSASNGAGAAPTPARTAFTPKPKPPAPVRPKTGPYAKDLKFLDEVTDLLQADRAIYQEQATSLRAEADSLALEREPGDVQFDEESGEGGTVTVDRERNLALSGQAVLAVEEIDDAMVRIKDKTFGYCERCFQPIPKPRLRALPYARLCVACKSGGLSRR